MIIELPWPPKVLSPNKRAHWATKAVAAKKYKNDCLVMLASQRPELTKKFSIIFCPPNNIRRDRDNVIAAFKYGQDALAHYWGVDDSEFEINYKPFGDVIKHGRVLVCMD